MSYQESQGLETPSFALPVQIPDLSENLMSDIQPEQTRTALDEQKNVYRTWNWTEAAAEIGINESMLRKIWWEIDIEPAFRYCPTPLRIVARTIKRTGREISEFTAFGIEVLKAYKAAKEKGERVAEQFLAEAKAKYLPSPSSTTSQPTQTPRNSTVEVESGNHQVVCQSPNLLQRYNLQGLRRDQSVQFEDPLAIAQQFLTIAEQLQTAMENDLEQREDKLNQTRKAREAITNKAQELKLETRLYQERAHQVDTAQTQETEALQEALQVLDRLGKPTVGSGSPS
jgi:hypothetical protein